MQKKRKVCCFFPNTKIGMCMFWRKTSRYGKDGPLKLIRCFLFPPSSNFSVDSIGCCWLVFKVRLDDVKGERTNISLLCLDLQEE